MRVLIGARIPEELRGVLQARAVLEGRSFSNLVERLLELGLGVIGPVGPVPCSRVLFHGSDSCSECGWSPLGSLSATVALKGSVAREVKTDFKQGAKV